MKQGIHKILNPPLSKWSLNPSKGTNPQKQKCFQSFACAKLLHFSLSDVLSCLTADLIYAFFLIIANSIIENMRNVYGYSL